MSTTVTAGTDPVDPHREAAREAGLLYVNDGAPGIRRVRSGKGFRYVDADGHAVRDAARLARIRSLVIPPAWEQVWICPTPRGHIQATGRDARGRKQYRYHPRWREVRDETKYGQLVAFGRALPALRRRLERDLARPGLPREKVLATIVRLLETTRVRVGNEEYARANKSFGLTTLRDRHVDVRGSELKFEFVGKAGKPHRVAIDDRRLAKIVKACQDIPGQELFQYVDDDGGRKSVGSADVNAYLREISGMDITAKLFRTWAGTVEALAALRALAPCHTATETKKNLVQVTREVASMLNNTPAVCRKCYIHPAVFECYTRGALADAVQAAATANAAPRGGLSTDERLALAFLAAADRAARRRGATTRGAAAAHPGLPALRLARAAAPARTARARRSRGR